ncbi:MAG TPA: hypothetical protein VF705_11035 [Longimicrobium sp.]
MAESRWQWNRGEWDALLFLGQLAADRAGYQLRGVRGWAHLNDIQEAFVGGSFEVLPRLHARGLLERADVRAPGRVLPEWVYRVTPRGVQVLEAQGRKPDRAIPASRRPEAEPAVYAPSRQRGALLLLRGAYDDLAVPVHFGGRGWVTGRELGARVEAANRLWRRRRRRGSPFYAVDGTDLRWLVGKGLVERRDDPTRPHIVWWRVTELGRSVTLLDWKPVPDERARAYGFSHGGG